MTNHSDAAAAATYATFLVLNAYGKLTMRHALLDGEQVVVDTREVIIYTARGLSSPAYAVALLSGARVLLEARGIDFEQTFTRVREWPPAAPPRGLGRMGVWCTSPEPEPKDEND
jgi:hypothetical protein